MAPGYIDEVTVSEAGSLSNVSVSTEDRYDHGHRSPNVASVRKVMREEHHRRDSGNVSMDLGGGAAKRRSAAAGRRRREPSSSLSSQSYTSSSSLTSSSDFDSGMDSSLSSSSSARRELPARRSRRAPAAAIAADELLYDESPVRNAPRTKHATADLTVDESDEEEFMNTVHRSEDKRLPIFIPSERVQEEEWFPLRKTQYAPPLRSVSSASHVVLPQELLKPESVSSSSVSAVERQVTYTSSSSITPVEEPPVEEPPVEEEEEKDDDVVIPEWLQDAASAEMIDPKCLKPLLKENGLQVRSCTTLFKTNKYILEFFPAELTLSEHEPILRLRNTEDGKNRLLIPDTEATPILNSPTMGSSGNPMAPFNGYEFPLVRHEHSDELTSVETHLVDHPGVLSWFANLRVPAWFEMKSDQEIMDLQKALLILRRALNMKNSRKRQHFSYSSYTRPQCLPPPTLLNGSRKEEFLSKMRSNHKELEAKTGELLDDACRRLVTSRPVSYYWMTEQKVWTTFYSRGSRPESGSIAAPPNGPVEGGKWKRVHLRVWVHPYTNDVIISDKDGGVLGPVVDFTRYSAYGRTFKDNDEHVPLDVAVINKNTHLTYLNYYGGLDNVAEDKLWLAFETLEKLKDFQQTLASCVFLHDRRCSLDDHQLRERTDYGLFH